MTEPCQTCPARVELDKWWKITNAQEKNGIRAKAQSFLTYEINELARCLERPEPNINMALSRVRNIRRYMDADLAKRDSYV